MSTTLSLVNYCPIVIQKQIVYFGSLINLSAVGAAVHVCLKYTCNTRVYYNTSLYIVFPIIVYSFLFQYFLFIHVYLEAMKWILDNRTIIQNENLHNGKVTDTTVNDERKQNTVPMKGV